jgi:hypothetical protein
MADIGTLNPEQMLQQQQILRQQKMAEMLMQQGMQQPQGQMISGRYVAPSIFQNLAGLANTYVGQRGIEKAEQAQIDLAKAIRGQEGVALADYMSQLQGRPAVPDKVTEMAGPYMGNIPKPTATIAGTPAIEGNPMLANMNALQNPNSPAFLRQLAMKKITEGPEGFILPEGANRVERQPDGSFKIVASGGDKTSSDYKDYQIAVKDPVSPFKGSFLDYQVGLKKAGATSINLPSEGERKAGFMSNILDRNILQMQTALGIDPKAVKPNVPASIASALTGPTLFSRSMTPAQRQIVEDSQLDVLDAALTLRTGAAYTPVQLTAMRETYFPVLGDKPPAIKAKKERLETLLEGAYIAAGRATPPRVSASPPPPAPQPNLNQQFGVPAIKAPRFLGFELAPTGQQK